MDCILNKMINKPSIYFTPLLTTNTYFEFAFAKSININVWWYM